MARTARWKGSEVRQGVIEYKLSSWKYFSDYINKILLNYSNYVFRGQADSNWKLEPTLDRVIKDPNSIKRVQLLKTFQYETRGRRGTNPPEMKSEYDWWALGQHYGLLTPLLDWTESPFVALYFAVSQAYKANTDSFAVYAFFQNSAEHFNKTINEDDKVELVNNHKPTLKIVKPLSDENNRLVSQRGLFTRGPNNIDIEEWVKTFNSYKEGKEMVLIKITIPSKELEGCLKYLNRMNINDATLFPDLTGASSYCNKSITIKEY
jgi:hypothetical protein